MNCPFYGRALYAHMVLPMKFLLLNTEGNQCAIVTDRHAPCMLDLDGQPVEWRDCPRMKDIRMERD